MSSPSRVKAEQKGQPDYADLGKVACRNPYPTADPQSRQTRHNPALGMMQSIFSPAALRQKRGIVTTRSSPRRWAKNGLD
jgi:hypothetical protein